MFCLRPHLHPHCYFIHSAPATLTSLLFASTPATYHLKTFVLVNSFCHECSSFLKFPRDSTVSSVGQCSKAAFSRGLPWFIFLHRKHCHPIQCVLHIELACSVSHTSSPTRMKVPYSQSLLPFLFPDKSMRSA